MKEKTFEELMHNKFDALEEYGGFKLSTKQQNAILELMKQVREATIAECIKCLTLTGHDDIPLHWIEQKYKMNQLPTDRIKTEK